MIRLALYLFIWIGAMAIAIFATQNTALVNLKFFTFESIKLPLGLVLIFCAGLGAVLTNIWQASVSFNLPTSLKFSGFKSKKSPFKGQVKAKTTEVKKDISRTNKKIRDDFDDDWDDDWG
jgi:uncharacterized integral membrane protein